MRYLPRIVTIMFVVIDILQITHLRVDKQTMFSNITMGITWTDYSKLQQNVNYFLHAQMRR